MFGGERVSFPHANPCQPPPQPYKRRSMGAQWKHKGRVEEGARKGMLFSRLSKEIIVAAKSGDPNPANNARLRAAVEAARRQSMPRDTIERAIKKGAGLLEAVNYETVVFEGFTPHRVPVIVECLTDNKNRTAQDIRVLFRAGQLGTGVQWMFNRVGVIEATHPQTPDPQEAAIEAGAQDVEVDEDGQVRFITDPTDLGMVNAALSAARWNISASELRWLIKEPVELAEDARAEVEEFLGNIDENDDVHRLYVGLK